MALLASAPIFQPTGGPCPRPGGSASAAPTGVVRGPHQWHERLERHARILRTVVAEERAVHRPRAPARATSSASSAATRELQAFVAGLRSRLAVDARTPAGASCRGWAERLVHDHLAPERPPRRLARAASARRPTRSKPRSNASPGLDAVEDPPGLDVFRRTLELELDADLGRVGRLGDGILMGHVALGLGLDLDRVFVCGLAEGTFPARVRDDSLLPDADRPRHRRRARRCAGRGSTTTTGASSPRSPPRRDERVLLFPRGDLRRTTERVPSRFLLDTRRRRSAATRRCADELEQLTRRLVHAGAVVRGRDRAGRRSPPPSRNTACACCSTTPAQAARVGDARSRRPSTSPSRRGLDATIARAEHRVHPLRRQPRRTRRRPPDRRRRGRLADPPGDLGHVPARRTSWNRSCGSSIPELPEETLRAVAPRPRQPRPRGARRLPPARCSARPGARRRPTRRGPPPTGPGSARSPRRRPRPTRPRGSPGGGCSGDATDGGSSPTSTASSPRTTTHARRSTGCATIATELRFGFAADGAPGRSRSRSPTVGPCASAGAADRVDRAGDGTLWVIDYKTGMAAGHRRRRPDRRRAPMLQLPVYAHARRRVRPVDPARTPVVGAAYWFVSSTRRASAGPSSRSPTRSSTRVDDVAARDHRRHRAGVFPCRLDPPSSWALPRGAATPTPTARGTRDRYREWQRKRDAPELAGLRGPRRTRRGRRAPTRSARWLTRSS